MRKYVLVLILLLVVIPMWSATKRALLIGISDYPVYKNMDGASWGSIHGANDVLMIGNTLKLKGFSVTSLVNSNATATNIRKAFRKLLLEVKAGDVVYLHFSCHGQPFEDMNGDEEDGWDEAIVPYDAMMTYKRGVYDGSNHIIDDELHTYFNNLRKTVGKSGFVCVVIDACHAGNSYMGNEEEEDENFCRGTKKGFSPNAKDFHPRINAKGHFVIPKKQGFADIIIMEACRSYQSNYEIKKENTYYGPLSYYTNKVLLVQPLNRGLGWVKDVEKYMASNLTRQNMVYESSLE